VEQTFEKHGGEGRLLSPGAGYLFSFLLKKRETSRSRQKQRERRESLPGALLNTRYGRLPPISSVLRNSEDAYEPGIGESHTRSYKHPKVASRKASPAIAGVPQVLAKKLLLPNHPFRKIIKCQRFLFFLGQASHRFGIAFAIFGFEGLFFLSLVALLPQTNLGSAALVLSVIGLANQCFLGWDLFRHTERRWLSMVRGAVLIVVGLLLYGGELYNALLLVLSPTDSAPLYALAGLLLGTYALGLTRAWQLLGGRGHGLGEWLSPLHTIDGRQPGPNTDQTRSATSARNDESA
jgi:hypothetical protein